jgi:hypothetical protein
MRLSLKHARFSLGRVRFSLKRVSIPIILIGNIDYAVKAGHGGTMAPHLSTKRRHVDLLLVASAICPAALLSRLYRFHPLHRPG